MELILVCHEKIQSDFENIDLSPSGIEAVKQLAEKMKKNYSFDIAYTSNLKIANRTLNYILEEMNELEIPINKSETLNTITRKDLEGKNVFESLKSYWKSDISKNLKEGKNILIVTDEDTIRILIKYLLDMSDRDIQDVYIPIDNTFYFEVDKNLEVISAGFPIQKVLERIDEF
ncbi:histidine phosphatase family protein [Fusobacterium nucleatum]